MSLFTLLFCLVMAMQKAPYGLAPLHCFVLIFQHMGVQLGCCDPETIRGNQKYHKTLYYWHKSTAFFLLTFYLRYHQLSILVKLSIKTIKAFIPKDEIPSVIVILGLNVHSLQSYCTLCKCMVRKRFPQVEDSSRCNNTDID